MVRVETREGEHHFTVAVELGGLDADSIRVELFANPIDAEPPRQLMARGRRLAGSTAYEYSARVPASRPAGDFTPRVVPHQPEARVPLEAPYVLWAR